MIRGRYFLFIVFLGLSSGSIFAMEREVDSLLPVYQKRFCGIVSFYCGAKGRIAVASAEVKTAIAERVESLRASIKLNGLPISAFDLIVNQKDGEGSSLLSSSCFWGNLPVVQALLAIPEVCVTEKDLEAVLAGKNAAIGQRRLGKTINHGLDSDYREIIKLFIQHKNIDGFSLSDEALIAFSFFCPNDSDKNFIDSCYRIYRSN